MIDEAKFRQMIREEIAKALADAKDCPTKNEYLSQNEAAMHCSVTTATIRNWHDQGLQVCRQGRMVRYRRSDLDGFMRQTRAVDKAAELAAQFLRG